MKAECSCSDRPFFPLTMRGDPTGGRPGLERVVSFMPGYRCDQTNWEDPSDSPGTSHGKASAQVVFLVRGPAGAVQFLMALGLYPDGEGGVEAPRDHTAWMNLPTAYDLGFHAAEPRDYEIPPRDRKSVV